MLWLYENDSTLTLHFWHLQRKQTHSTKINDAIRFWKG